MPKIRNTILREGIYYFKKRIPADIAKTYSGKDKEGEFVQKTLGTGDFKSAKILKDQMLADTNRRFEQHRIKQKKVNSNDFNISDELSSYSDSQLIIPVLNWLEYSTQNDMLSKDEIPLTDNELNEIIDDVKTDKSNFQEAYAHNDNQYGVMKAEKELKRQGISYDNKSKAFKKIARLFSEALVEDAERRLLNLNSQPIAEFINPKFKPSGLKPITISKVIQNYIEHHQENWLEHTYDANITAFNLIEDFFGTKKELHDITRDDCRAYRNIIDTLPTYFRRDFPRSKYSFKEALTLAKSKGNPTIAVKTKNNNIQALEMLMSYAVAEGNLDRHYASDLRFLDKEAKKNKRLSFTDDHLKCIFTAPLYTGCKNADSGYKIQGNCIPKDKGRFWVPLLALWTGMRAGECVQLETKDIGQEQGINVIYIRESNDPDYNGDSTAYTKRVKNQSSIRYVPVPPMIERIGFLKFVQIQKNNNQTRLFPELKPTKKSNSATFTKWFNEGFLKEYLPERKKHKETFHSFRHTYKDAMVRAGVPIDKICALGGWTTNMGSVEHYGGAVDAKILYDYISEISYPKIDFSHLVDD